MKKQRRPADTRPGELENRGRELGERVRHSHERLMASDLAMRGPAWRLWAVCVDATAGYARSADKTYVVELARKSRMQRQAASKLLRRFDELGVFGWQPAPRGSHGAGRLELLMSATRTHEGVPGSPHECEGHPLQSNDVMSVEPNTHNSSLDTGMLIDPHEQWLEERRRRGLADLR